MEDGEVAGGEFRKGFEAVAGAGAEVIQTAEGVKGDGDGGLQRGDAHALRVPRWRFDARGESACAMSGRAGAPGRWLRVRR